MLSLEIRSCRKKVEEEDNVVSLWRRPNGEAGVLDARVFPYVNARVSWTQSCKAMGLEWSSSLGWGEAYGNVHVM